MITILECITREKLRIEIEKKAKAKELKSLKKCRKGIEPTKESKTKKNFHKKKKINYGTIR